LARVIFGTLLLVLVAKYPEEITTSAAALRTVISYEIAAT
jgi:hypothetical protein